MTDTLPALRKTLRVDLPPQDAFDLFTLGIAEWWPMDTHSLSGREGHMPDEVRVQLRLGGRIIERRHDGADADWAEITGWDAGRSLALAWHVGRARTDATRIDVHFRPQGNGGTEISLIHSGFEVLGPAGEAAAANYDEGWDMVFGERFRRACQDQS